MHDESIDPSDWRNSTTRRCDCDTRVNIRRVGETGAYRISSINLAHNHPAFFDDALPQYCPPSEDQKAVIQELASLRSLNRGDIHTLLNARFPDHPLNPRQVSNLIDNFKCDGRNEVIAAGGDMVATVELLVKLKQADERWVIAVEADPVTRQFMRLFWMSPRQVELAQRFSDVVINDITYQRNVYGLPLNIWLVIDHMFKSRNIAYALHTSETIQDHKWCLDQLFAVLPAMCPPLPKRAYFSDYDLALDVAVSDYEDVWHGLCIHHMGGNLTKNLAAPLGPLFQPFQDRFYQVYYSISPDAFENSWEKLLEDYPRSRDYLQKIFWPTRERWAWAWVSARFSCGVRTSGRVESENRVNKLFGNSKTTLFGLVKELIHRSDDQDTNEKLAARQVCRFCC